VRFLLDTHLAVWLLLDDPRLTAELLALAGKPNNAFAVSAASIWEIAIKHARNRGSPNDMPLSGLEAIRAFREAGYDLLPITPAHAAAVGALPMLHADPFDRLLVAQATTDGLTLLTSDRVVASYSAAIRLV
jgi:PIN domain nuclease of toxin-antitoxin system